MTDETLPNGVQLTPLDPDFRDNPYEILDRVRQEAPILRDDMLGRWVMTRHDDVAKVLKDKSLSVDPHNAGENSLSRIFLQEGVASEDEVPSMLFSDDPAHKRLRSLVTQAFTPRAVEAMRPRVAEIVERLLADISADEFDFMAAFAAPLPTIVIAEMLGIDASMQAQFKIWSDTSAQAFFNPFSSEEEKAVSNQAGEALHAFFQNEINLRRDGTLERQADDLISAMINAETSGDRLSDPEIISNCNLLLVAGNITTTDLIGNGMKALCQNPDQWDKLHREPELLKNAVEEMLRFDTPVTNSGRILLEDTDVEGCPMRSGDSISPSLAAANHDPAVYPEPSVFDVARKDTHHHSFGGGVHMCLGAPLARLEAQEALSGLLRHFKSVRLSSRGYTYRATPAFRGMTELWVTAMRS